MQDKIGGCAVENARWQDNVVWNNKCKCVHCILQREYNRWCEWPVFLLWFALFIILLVCASGYVHCLVFFEKREWAICISIFIIQNKLCFSLWYCLLPPSPLPMPLPLPDSTHNYYENSVGSWNMWCAICLAWHTKAVHRAPYVYLHFIASRLRSMPFHIITALHNKTWPDSILYACHPACLPCLYAANNMKMQKVKAKRVITTSETWYQHYQCFPFAQSH